MQIYVSWEHANSPWAISPQAIVSRAIALGGGCPGMFVRGGLSRGICSTMAHGIFGANSSFGVGFVFFESFLLVLAKLSFSRGDWALG